MEGRSGGGTSILEVRELDSRAGVRVRVREKAMAPHSSTLAWKIAWRPHFQMVGYGVPVCCGHVFLACICCLRAGYFAVFFPCLVTLL